MKTRHQNTRIATLLAVSLALLTTTLSNGAQAHAFLDHSDPKVGADVDKSPSEVRIWLTQKIEPAFSTIKVFNSDGREVDKKDSHVDEKEKSLLIVSLESLPPGTYRVEWQVVSIDTHHTKGDFKFAVKH